MSMVMISGRRKKDKYKREQKPWRRSKTDEHQPYKCSKEARHFAANEKP